MLTPDLAQGMRLAVGQAAVLLAHQRIRVAGTGQLPLHGREVAGQGAQRAQQAAPGRVALDSQMLE